MINPEQQLQERALKVNFTEVQQEHFDRLMSELEQISGGFGFTELKVKAEAGDKDALQVLRDYVAKKEQIVEFIETKEIEIDYDTIPLRDKELRVGDLVAVDFFGDGAKQGEYVGERSDTSTETGESYLYLDVKLKNGKVVSTTNEHVARIIDKATGELDLNKYEGIYIGQKLEFRASSPSIKDLPAGIGLEDIESVEVICFDYKFGRYNVTIEFDLGSGLYRTMIHTPKSLKKRFLTLIMK